MNEYLPKVGECAIGTVVAVYSSYAILLFDEGWTGLLHISEVSFNYIRSFTSFITIGSIYNVKVIDVNKETKSVRVSLKQMTPSERHATFRHKKIDESEIDFKALEEARPSWIKGELTNIEAKEND